MRGEDNQTRDALLALACGELHPVLEAAVDAGLSREEAAQTAEEAIWAGPLEGTMERIRTALARRI